MKKTRVISWFSCGAASALTSKLALDKYGNNPDYDFQIIYCRVRQEHPDNLKFLKAFEKKYNVKIKILENKKHKGNIYDVFLKRKFLINDKGAPCTKVLKKDLRKEYQRHDDIQLLGYTVEEEEVRLNRFIDGNPEVILDTILIDRGITKKDCMSWLMSEGFELPTMYKLGYHNNNCIGCVKGGMGYWNAIREDFPDRFEAMAKMERLLGHSINREVIGKTEEGKNIYGKVFLDELAPNRGNFKRDQPADCGFTCEWKERNGETP